ncbi:MAG TPA: non-ribosomal peptide synthetase, partial [Holophaga sp.]|nr:non-ribosomal peptide synthetase [Holophaga sp.]
MARPFTQPRPGPPREERLTDLFEAAAALHGERPALEGEGLRLTYRDLDAASSRLARLLAERGAGPGVHVGILLPRSPAMIIAVLAVLKAGAAYVPLDPEYPPGRVEAILGDAGARLLVSDLGLSSRIGLGPWDLVLPDREGPALDALPCQPVPQRAGPGDPCYAIFTSGSTGRPKGVSVSHRAACNLVRAEGWIFGVEPEDRVYQGFSLAFDASVEEIWLAFHAGACLVVADAMTARSGPLLPAWLGAKGITVLSTVPTVLGTFQEDIPGLGLLIVGGEACPPDLAARWAPGRRLVNTYGPTEATVIATWTDLEPGRPVTIGRAIPNLRTLVLDAELRPAAPGAEGELCLAGAGLALGYLGRPDLTAERFPTLRDGTRIYRTGDKVREGEDGDLLFLGRLDDQVKLRGFRIELGEIEAALRLQDGVLEAAAAVRPWGGGEILVGYVALRPGAPSPAALRQALGALLPPYMVPSRILALEALPLLPSGKLDRKALPPPPAAEGGAADAAEAPATETEAALASAWAGAFHRPVGPGDDFFTDLGGHSLLAAVMVSGLRPRPGFGTLSVPDVYAFPTVRAL